MACRKVMYQQTLHSNIPPTERPVRGSVKNFARTGAPVEPRPSTPGTLFACGINYKTAPVEIREKLYLNDEEIERLLSMARTRLSECLVISTCNRTEIYGVSSTGDVDIQFLKSLLIEIKENARDYLRDEHFFALISCAASQQLFNVATSI